jgi:tetratricopeptide (TPR) repeat protein
MIDALFLNPSFGIGKGPERQLYHIRGQLYLREGKPELALIAFRRSLEAMPDPEAALVQAALLASHGNYAKAREILELAAGMKTEKSANLLDRRDYAGEINRLRRMVEEEMTKTPTTPIPAPVN